MCFRISQVDLRMLGEQSAGTDGGRKTCDVSCGERVALIPSRHASDGGGQSSSHV